MALQVTIHFTKEITAKIAAETGNPAFKFQKFENALRACFDGNFLVVTVASKENTVDGEAQYFYNTATIDRIKAIEVE